MVNQDKVDQRISSDLNREEAYYKKSRVCERCGGYAAFVGRHKRLFGDNKKHKLCFDCMGKTIKEMNP